MSNAVSDAVAHVTEWVDGLPQWAKYGLVACVATIGALVVKQRMSKVTKPITKDWKKGKVYLYQFGRTYVVPSLSPFSMKLETWLRMANIDYENVELPDMWSVRSKEGTLPFVELDGVEYPDSALIIRDLTAKFNKETLTAHLSPAELGVCRAVDKMCEHSTLLSYAFIRYTEHIGELFSEKVMPTDKFGTFAVLSMKLFLPFFKKTILKNFKIIGIGKHSREEIINIGCDDLKALSAILDDKQYFLGSKPTATDACVFSLVGQILYIPIDTPHKDYIKKNCANLVQHAERVKQAFWPDWEMVTTKLQTQSDAWKKQK